MALGAIALAADLMVPGFIGIMNDDGVYATTARALAAGQGYVHPFAPELTPANRYPIGYPLLLVPCCWLLSGVQAQVTAMQGLSLACLGLFVGASGWLAARGLKLGAAGGLAVAAVLAVHPWLLRFGSQVMADLPFAAGSTLALAGVCAARDPRRHWLPLGVALGLLGLVRYQGLALPLAILLYLAAHRRWREGLALGAGLVLPLLPWAAYLGYLATRGHAVYDGAQVARALAGGGSLLVSLKLLLLRVIPGSFLATSVPAVPDDPLVALPTVPDLMAGVAFTGLVAVGLVRARGEAIAWYVAVSLLLIALWNANFVFLGYAQAVRLGLPLLPLLLALGWRQTPARWRAGAAAVLVAVGLGAHLQHRDHPLIAPERAAAYLRAMAFMRDHLPPGAPVGSLMAPMTYLYSGHPGRSYPLDDPAAFKALHLDYVLVQAGLYGYMTNGRDPVEAFVQQAGPFQVLYQDPPAGLAVLRYAPRAMP